MNQQFSTKLSLAQLPELDEAKDPKLYSELLRIRASIKVLQSALDIYTGALGETDDTYWAATPITKYFRLQNVSRIYIQATENIAAGAIVNLYNNAGTLCARNSLSGASQAGDAYSSNAVVSGDFGEFILWGAVSITSALTPRSVYYIANTPGDISVAAGVGLVQKVGWAISDHILFFRPDLV